MRSRHVFVRTLASTAAVVAFIAACSGSLSPIGSGIVDTSDSSSTSDGSSSNDGSSSTDGSSTADAKTDGGGGGKDTGGDPIVVNEKPSPTCHDLTQHAAAVTHVGNASLAPAQVPITTIPPGLYVLTSATDYGGAMPIDDPPSTDKTTVVFTATRQYYLSETATGSVQALTLDWKITNNRLIRKVLCSQATVGGTVDYRIDGAPNGFIVYVPPQNVSLPGRIHAYRYTRVD